LTVLLVGCAALSPGEPVALLTGDADGNNKWLGDGFRTCLPQRYAGHLVVDPEHGTAIQAEDGSDLLPVMWPIGFTASRSADVVTVRDPDGRIEAKTGRDYVLEGGPWQDYFAACRVARF
jgi:hypothetical protein